MITIQSHNNSKTNIFLYVFTRPKDTKCSINSTLKAWWKISIKCKMFQQLLNYQLLTDISKGGDQDGANDKSWEIQKYTNEQIRSTQILTMRRKGGDEEGANNKSWEMFQELIPYRGRPLPHYFYKSQYHCNTIHVQYQYTILAIPLHCVEYDTIQNHRVTHTRYILCIIWVIGMHYFSIMECNTLPLQYITTAIQQQYHTMHCNKYHNTLI